MNQTLYRRFSLLDAGCTRGELTLTRSSAVCAAYKLVRHLESTISLLTALGSALAEGRSRRGANSTWLTRGSRSHDDFGPSVRPMKQQTRRLRRDNGLSFQ